MKQLDKYLNAILVLLILGVAIATFVHVIRSYDRMMAQRPEVTVTIPEGFTMYDIDRTLSANGVLAPGAFVAAVQAYGESNDFANSDVSGMAAGVANSSSLEGMLFPDTYDFYVSSTASSVIQKFLDNFNIKAAPLFAGDPQEGKDIIVASMVQKEVASSSDMALVAGILEKRLSAGDYLNVDATICYAKQIAEFAAASSTASTTGCYPITAADLKIESPYNTYLYKGLAPTSIANPGIEAIEATLHPQSSTYWYYLSDPRTGAAIYADTLAEQNANIAKYLGE